MPKWVVVKRLVKMGCSLKFKVIDLYCLVDFSITLQYLVEWQQFVTFDMLYVDIVQFLVESGADSNEKNGVSY